MKKRIWALALALCLLLPLLPNAAAGEIAVEVNKNAVLSGLFEADITSLRQALDLGWITSRELTEYYLDRIEKYDAPYDCFITICPDALQQADARDAQTANGEKTGVLHGIPVVVKDNMDVAGLHTTNGHKKQPDQIAEDNAAVVQKLIDAGAVILAKTNQSKDCQSAYDSKSDFGEVKNAYNPYYSPGGSSGGSAVSVSLNFAAAALGTDTNSSLRIPAALAGCFALRPTFDLISRDGVVQLNSKRDTVGAITRSASDLAVMMDILTDGAYSYVQNRDKNVLKGLRLGLVKELCYPTATDSDRKEENLDSEVQAVFAAAVSELEKLGAEVVEVSFRDIFYLANLTSGGSETHIRKLYDTYLSILEKNNVSALIYPTYLSTPLKTGRDENGKYWSVWSDEQIFINNCRSLSSCARLPEISIPIGHHSAGPGIGLEIAAPRYAEQLLLDIALAYSEGCSHRVAPAGAPDEYAAFSMGSLQNVLRDYYTRLEAAQNPPTEPPAAPSGEKEDSFSLAGATVIICVSAVTIANVIAYRLRKRKEEQAEKDSERLTVDG